MEKKRYSTGELAKLSGTTARALRFYDEIGLLCPLREGNNYRVYDSGHADKLQQIMFYRELGVSPEKIKDLLGDPRYDRQRALEEHLAELTTRKDRLGRLIRTLTETIASVKGETVMKDKEKFEGFRQKMLDENEKKYGKEIRERYGEETVRASNARFRSMAEAQAAEADSLSRELNATLAEAVMTNDPAGEAARKACALHRKWLCCYWPEGNCSAEAHKALVGMYTEDERFTAYYEAIAPGCAAFLRDAVNLFYGDPENSKGN